jgi:hypothetical protein
VASYRVSKNANNNRNETTQGENQRESDWLRYLKVSVDTQTAFTTKTHRGEGQLWGEQRNMVKLRMLQPGIMIRVIIIILIIIA